MDIRDKYFYEIRVLGHIDKYRLLNSVDISVTHAANGETVITGYFYDQPALYGLLNWIGDRGIALLSVRHVNKTEDL